MCTVKQLPLRAFSLRTYSALSLPEKLSNAFHFYSDLRGTNASYHLYGNLPWWASEHVLMNLFRPLAAFTQYYRLL